MTETLRVGYIGINFVSSSFSVPFQLLSQFLPSSFPVPSQLFSKANKSKGSRRTMGNFEAKKRKNKEIALKKQLKTPKFGSVLCKNSQ